MAPLVKEFQKQPERVETVVCVTGQHREMLDQVCLLYTSGMRPELASDLKVKVLILFVHHTLKMVSYGLVTIISVSYTHLQGRYQCVGTYQSCQQTSAG